MKKQTLIIAGVVGVVLVGLFVWIILGLGAVNTDTQSKIQEIAVDPIDTAMALYNPWLAVRNGSATTTTLQAVLDKASLTPELKVRLEQAATELDAGIDPVLCQPELPGRIGAKSIYTNDTEAQLVVVARGTKIPEQALVTLVVVDNQWVMSDISCSRGELAPEVEFSFESEGNILRESLQPPLDNTQWHLVYSRDDVAGYTIPLFFNELSVCITEVEAVCDPAILSEVTRVTVQGAMQEAGVLVERMQLQ